MFRDDQQRIQPGYAASALNQTYCGAMQPADVSESLLRNSFSFTQAPHAVAEGQENFLHGTTRFTHTGLFRP
jgi:hypothetical protein